MSVHTCENEARCWIFRAFSLISFDYPANVLSTPLGLFSSLRKANKIPLVERYPSMPAILGYENLTILLPQTLLTSIKVQVGKA